MRNRTVHALATALALIGTAAATPPPAQPTQPDRRCVIFTNDNGSDDPKLVARARAFALRAET